MVQNLPPGKKIVLFDGVCNLCDNVVQYIIRHDKNDIFRFTAVQSEIGRQIISHVGYDVSQGESVIVYDPGVAYYIKAAAAIEIGKHLGTFNRMTWFRLVPVPLRNIVYDFVARNRYRWFGKKESCMMPTPELKKKFL
ncbi:MAG: DUF393 domain-containing protein [Flavobacterium sp.]|nr:MAG: DUF393 domain-containing protein [Flavobacterium sp.]